MGAAFAAVQLVDIAWAGFILTGVEHARLTPGFLAASNLDLYDMPWTHALPAALAWSAAAALVYRLIARSGGWASAIAIGALVFSHWILDFLVHTNDLLLYPGGPRVGLGWWDNPPLAMGAELGLFALGFVLYLRATTAAGAVGRIAPWLTAGLMLAVLAFEKLGPVPPSIEQAATSALIVYLLFVAMGFWLDRVRVFRRASLD
ncbi:MAG: hypothetical protein AB7J28_08040 [Hyphomonadaceae bacterium]